jgi:exonuclease VII small subunit
MNRNDRRLKTAYFNGDELKVINVFSVDLPKEKFKQTMYENGVATLEYIIDNKYTTKTKIETGTKSLDSVLNEYEGFLAFLLETGNKNGAEALMQVMNWLSDDEIIYSLDDESLPEGENI